MKAIIHITLKAGVLDPQGEALARALQSMGFEEVSQLRVGKIVEMTLDETDKAKAQSRVTKMCQELISNTVIEDYDIHSIC